MGACKRNVLAATLAGVVCGAGLAEAQVQAWATRFDSGPITSQDARLAGGDAVRGKHAVATDAAGSTYATGTLAKGDQDCVTLKHNAAGVIEWSAVYDSGGPDLCWAVVADNAGGVYVGGSGRTLKYDAATGAQQWVLAADAQAIAWDGTGLVIGTSGAVRKLNGAGTQVWSQAITGNVVALFVDAAANVYATGPDWNGTSDDYGTSKLDATGALLWSRRYNGTGNNSDQPRDIGVDGAANVYVTGQSFNGSNYDAVTVKYNAAGTQQWAATYNGGNSDEARALAVDPGGDVYVAGVTFTATTGSDFLTIRYNAAGAAQWTELYNTGGSSVDEACAIILDTSGPRVFGVSMVGSSLDFRTIRYNPAGHLSWAVAHGVPTNRSDVAITIAVDNSGDVVIGGNSQGGTISDQSSFIHLVRYNNSGAEQWAASSPTFSVDPDDRPVVRKGFAADAAGNTYVLGSSFDGQGLDYRVVKHGPAGAILWTRSYAGPAVQDAARALALDAAGNVYVTGTSRGLGNNDDYLTIKYDGAGTLQWTARYNGGSFDNAQAIGVDGSGNVYVTGHSHTGTSYDYRTVKYNAAGVQQWAVATGGPSEDLAQALTVDATGNVYVTGYSYNGVTSDYRTVKLDTTGALQWNVLYNGAANGYDEARAVAVDGAGNVYVTGMSHQSATLYDFVTVKYDGTGAEQWAVAYNGTANNSDLASEIALDASGNVYVAGSARMSGTGEDYAVVKYDPAGVQQWAASYSRPASTSERPNQLVLDAAGNAYLTGTSSGATGLDYWTVKVDSTGTNRWAVAFNGPASAEDQGAGIALDAAGNVYVTGASREASGLDFLTIKYTQDNTAPTNPAVASTSHTPSTWSNVGSIAMQWSGAADDVGGIGVAGYSHLFDVSASTTPDVTIDTTHATDPHATASSTLPDGASYFFHLRTCDAAGNCSAAVHAGPYFIDRTDPAAPSGLASTSHTPSTSSTDRTIDVAWTAAIDPLSNGVASDIDGYSVFFDGSASPACDFAKDVEEGTTSATSASLADGTWYAHVCARDNAGNWSAVATAGPYVIENQADLSVTKTDGQTAAVPGQSITYTITVANAGPSSVSGAT